MSYKFIVVFVGLVILASNFVFFLNLGSFYRFELEKVTYTLRYRDVILSTCNLNFHYKNYIDRSSNHALDIQAKNKPEAQKFFNDLVVCIKNNNL